MRRSRDDRVDGIKVDLHTHTYRSGDAGTTFDEYCSGSASMDLVAVTDHHDLFAGSVLQDQYGLSVIVGEEINTGQGEVIGLYLSSVVPRGLGLVDTCRRIRHQGGLVYIPHPTDARRHGIGGGRLAGLCQAGLVDIVEVGNSKAVTVDREAQGIAHAFGLPVAASSDAHVGGAIGSSHTVIDRLPSGPDDLLGLLGDGRCCHQFFDPVRDLTKTVVTPGTSATPPV